MINLRMRKIAALTASIAYLINAASVFALQVAPPGNVGINGQIGPSVILTNVFRIIYIVAALLVLFFLVLGAFNWITSGGDKEKVGKARGQIINALIGLAILALAFVIINVVGAILNINVLQN